MFSLRRHQKLLCSNKNATKDPSKTNFQLSVIYLGLIFARFHSCSSLRQQKSIGLIAELTSVTQNCVT